MAIDVGKAIGYLDLDTSGFERGFKTALDDLKVFQDKSASFGDKISSLGSSLTSAGKSMTTGVTLPLVGIGTAAVKTASDFDSAMSQVQATMGLTADSTSVLDGATVNTMDSLRDLAREMGESTKFSASEAAEAINNMAMAGYNTEEIFAALPQVLNLAAAGGISLDYATQLAANGLNVMGLGVESTEELADKLAVTASSAYGSVSDFGEGLLVAGGQAKLANLDLTDTFTALGILGDAGISAGEGGTYLRNTLKNLYTPTKDAKEALQELGVETANDDGTLRGFQDVLQDLGGALDGLSEEDRITAMSKIFDTRTIAAASALIKDSGDRWDELSEKISNSDEAAQNMADTLLDNLGGQLTILKSALEGIAISFGEILMPAIRSFTDKLQNFADWINNLSDSQKQMIVTIASVAAAIGPVLLILGNLFKTISKISGVIQALPNVLGITTGVFKSIGTAIAGISAPLIAVIATVGLLVAAFKQLWTTNEEFRNKVTAIWESVKNKFTEFGQGIVDRLNELGFNFESITDVIKSVWEGFCNFLAPIFEDVFNGIAVILESALDILMGLFDMFSGLFSGDWETLWNGIKEIFTGIWEILKSALQGALDFFNEIFGGFFTWLSEAWTNLWDSVSEFFSDIWESMRNGLIQWIGKINKNIREFANNIVTWFKETPKKMLDIGRNIVEGLWNGIKGAASWLKEKIFGFANGIIDGFREAFGIASPSKVMRSQGDYLMQGLALGISNSVDLVKTQIQTVADTVTDTLDEAFSTARRLSVSTDFSSGEEEDSVQLAKIGPKNSSESSGNNYTFVYNSPEAVNPVRAAKLLKQTAQQLALEF